MTRNRKLKRRIRDLQRESNLSYAHARRTVVLKRSEPSRHDPARHYPAIDMTTRLVLRTNAIPGARDFQGQQLAGATFCREDLRYASFVGADLRHTDFSGADLTGADFSQANLESACFRGTRFYSLGRCDFRRAEDFARCVPAIALFCGARLVSTAFDRAELGYADFTGADTRRASFANAELRMAKLVSCNLADAELSDTWLWGADLTRAVLEGARLDGSAGKANFSAAKLAGASLVEADFSESSFRHADMRGVDLRHASIARADVTGACLEQVQYSLTTRFADYDPENPPPPKTNDPAELYLVPLFEALFRLPQQTCNDGPAVVVASSKGRA